MALCSDGGGAGESLGFPREGKLEERVLARGRRVPGTGLAAERNTWLILGIWQLGIDAGRKFQQRAQNVATVCCSKKRERI